MPIIRSARKKMRKDRWRTKHNLEYKLKIKSLLKNARRVPNTKSFQELQSALDKAVKTHLIHRNTASRLKARLSKASSNATEKKTPKKAPSKHSSTRR